ncbi:hypothetical protein QYE76_015070 [Lolium multiflorum]|uniref:AAA+ ATPase At3g28540-like C-terminal domain-containing protein n=1 Tax=Lolium multiflorum TaxID=4521 RepID=A0AAD8X627_LOLMU|nr:hypothetical protein QYE76_015070 [Lolium multiflorum]
MDMHIHMEHCTPEAFQILANNYHTIDSHATHPDIEELIKEVTVTPVEVAKVLMRNDDTDAALGNLAKLLNSEKKNAASEIKTEDKRVDEKTDGDEIKTEDKHVDEKKDANEIKTKSARGCAEERFHRRRKQLGVRKRRMTKE